MSKQERNYDLLVRIAATLLMLTLILCLTGCSTMKSLDEAWWGAPAGTNTASSQPVLPGGIQPSSNAPPILEWLAGGLALLGFGGLSYAMHRTQTAATAAVASQVTNQTGVLAEITNTIEAIAEIVKKV